MEHIELHEYVLHVLWLLGFQLRPLFVEHIELHEYVSHVLWLLDFQLRPLFVEHIELQEYGVHVRRRYCYESIPQTQKTKEIYLFLIPRRGGCKTK